MPASLRFLKGLVITLMITMILGVIAVVWALVTRMPDGRVQLPITGSGKVMPNQRVLVRLDNFPYQEYGQIEGFVASKSAVPKNGLLPILVNLPAGLKTSYGKTLVFEQKMQGTAHIITENRRLIERIFEGLKSLWKN